MSFAAVVRPNPQVLICDIQWLAGDTSTMRIRVDIGAGLIVPIGMHAGRGEMRSRDLLVRGDVAGELRLRSMLMGWLLMARECGYIACARPADSETTGLSRREVEVLQWTKEGKTAGEVGAILGISERTAVKHLRGAMGKLKCYSKFVAVQKAESCGLI